MKITIKNTQSENPVDVCLKDLWPGTVFEFNDGSIAVKGGLNPEDAFILVVNDGTDWCSRVDGYKTEPIKRILGKLVEIVVETI